MYNGSPTQNVTSETTLQTEFMLCKVVMQGKLIASRILCVRIETSSLWAEFVNKNRCISVRLVSEEVKSIKF